MGHDHDVRTELEEFVKPRNLIREYRDFVMRGNVVDLAVGVVAGAAFSSVVTSFVSDVITPLIGVIAQSPDFTGIVLLGRNDDTLTWFTTHGATGGIRLGEFLNVLLSFMLTMLGVFFLVVKPLNSVSDHLKAGVASRGVGGMRACPACLTDVPVAATRCRACTSDIAPLISADEHS